LCIGISSLPGLAQTTRPRVAVTPTPPVMRGGQSTQPSEKRPPVLQGGATRASQDPDDAEITGDDDEDGTIKVQTNLVTMPVSVLDRDGRFISGLRQQDFKIFENGVEQKVDYFQSVEQPFTVVLLIDVSPSTQWQIEDIHRAAIAFIDQLRPDDKIMVMAFDERVQVHSRPTNNRAVLRSAIRETQMGDGTSLYEAVHHVINRELRQIPGRKAVVLFTDGVDTTSRRANSQSTLADVEETDALFYPIRYDTSRDMGGGVSYPPSRRRGGGGWGGMIGIILGGGQWPVPGTGGGAGGSRDEYEAGKRYLEGLAQNSGGRKFEADSLTNLDAAFAGIAEELRRQYSLGYYPEVVGKIGERKQIRIRVERPNVVVRAKTSYIVGDANRNLAGN
jgi:Ca-activated chloride channel family protein